MAADVTIGAEPRSWSDQYRSAKWGIVYMLLAIAMLSCMDAIGKWLIENAIHTVQILALRSVMIVPFLLLSYLAINKVSELRPTRPVAHALRGMAGFVAVGCFFTAISQLPLTTAVVIFFSSIFMTTLLSYFFLGEQVGRHRWLAVAVGYLGVIIAIGPGSGGELSGYLLVLFASFMYTVVFISGKHLTATESIPSLVLSYNLYVGLIAMLLLPWFWQPMSLQHWIWAVVLSAFTLGGHFFITKSYSLAEASLIAPFEYTSILWTVAFDMLIWNQLPAINTWIGALIIIGSAFYVIHRERLRSVEH